MPATAARGGTLYVTLEPCSHHGKSPPCADAVIAAGVVRVVSAIEDPNPEVAGKGHARLRAAGITVEVGVGAAEARHDHAGHIRRMREGRPQVLLKLAISADGKAGAAGRKPIAITGEAVRDRVHLMRAQNDAVAVGIGTALADNPMLTCRLPGMFERSPVRVVFDSKLRLPLESRLVRSAYETPVWAIAGMMAPEAAEFALLPLGVEVLRSPESDDPLDLRDALEFLAAKGITRLMVEGGPMLAAAFIAADLVDEATLFYSPSGGRGGRGRSACIRHDGGAHSTPETPVERARRRRPARQLRPRVNGMFTGIISDLGEILEVKEKAEGLRRLDIACNYDPDGIDIGASIACSGICLTVVGRGRTGNRSSFAVDAAAETLRMTTASAWTRGTRLNLERSLRLGDELGGHMVSGHVDGIAELISRDDFVDMAELWLRAPAELARFIAAKGSVALDGVSLTVNKVEGDTFSVLIIPHTLKVTTLGSLRIGTRVNLEVDQMARYAARFLETLPR